MELCFGIIPQRNYQNSDDEDSMLTIEVSVDGHLYSGLCHTLAPINALCHIGLTLLALINLSSFINN